MALPNTILEKHCPSMNNLYLDDQGRNFRDRVVAAMEEYASEWKVKYDELKAENAALQQQHQELKDQNEAYEKVLKDIAKQQKSSEWEQEGDTEYAYDYIINLARKSLPGNEGKEGKV